METGLFIVRVYDTDGSIYEYEYGTLEHVRTHAESETLPGIVYKYDFTTQTEKELFRF